jgi:hypothetical protein
VRVIGAERKVFKGERRERGERREEREESCV